MSDKFVCGVIGFVVGAVTGGIFIGNVCRKRHLQKINEVETKYKNQILMMQEEDEPDDEDVFYVDDKFLNGDDNGDKDQKYYQELSMKYRSPSFDKEFGDHDHPHDDPPEDDDDVELIPTVQINMISEEEYEKQIEYRNYEHLKFYQQDGALVDEDDNVIQDQMAMIGYDAKMIIDDTYEDIIYVDNPADDMLYAIDIDHSEQFYRDLASVEDD